MDRRSFITTLLSISSLAVVTQPSSAIDRGLVSLDARAKVGQIVRMEWVKQEPVSARHYLFSKVDLQNHPEARLRALIQDDLRAKRFFYVNGLQLSKTEAALLAMLA
jgi:Mlc titration factor MtfA (ptsG expression regulator)